MREYTEIMATASVLDACPGAPFRFQRGGRTGGVETPDVLNDIIQWAMQDVVEDWNTRGVGFVIEEPDVDTPGGVSKERRLLNHLWWADNLFLIARGHAMLQAMIRDVTLAMRAVSFIWKRESLQVLWGSTVPRAQRRTVLIEQDGEQLVFTRVASLEVLGDVVAAEGGTLASWTRRGAMGTRNLQKSRMLFYSRRTPVLARVQALARGPGACYEYPSAT